MSFAIQKQELARKGPFLLSRNPIYLADLICFCGFALCLPPVGVLLPVLLYWHYTQLIRYEERNLEDQFEKTYQAYKRDTPRLLPSWRSMGRMHEAMRDFYINRDGMRHNAQYVLLIPGFIVGAFTGNLLHAILIGLPAVLDWAIVHTRIGLDPAAARQKNAERAAAALQKSKVFRDIIYAQCWEDPEADRQAFQTGPDDVIFSITSGGCNTLAFLADNPRKVYALDISRYQNYLLDLKMAAFRELDYDELLQFLGVLPCTRRMEMYQRLTRHMQPGSIDYWNGQSRKIAMGVIHSGRYENYMRLLRRMLSLLLGKRLLGQLFLCQTKEEREALYFRHWNNFRWRFFTRLFLSRTVMTMLFTRKFFDQLEENFSFGNHFRERVRQALIELPAKDNYFLAYILLGRFLDPEHLPPYLLKANYEAIKSRLDRIEMVNSDASDFFRSLPDGTISQFNFSNIFEWMPPGAFEALLRESIRVARNGAVMTYRNLLVPRSMPGSLARWIEPQPMLAQTLHQADRAFIYRAYQVEKVVKM